MRFLTFLTLSFFISLNTYSQGWIDGGIKAGFGVTQLVNKNVWDNSEVVNKLSFGNSFGTMFGITLAPFLYLWSVYLSPLTSAVFAILAKYLFLNRRHRCLF